jgi:hypothetical protein
LDCAGIGRLPSGLVRTEWRLRELERIYGENSNEAAKDMRWLISELRRSHHALLQIMAVGHDLHLPEAPESTGLSRIKFLANDVIGMYPVRPR